MIRTLWRWTPNILIGYGVAVASLAFVLAIGAAAMAKQQEQRLDEIFGREVEREFGTHPTLYDADDEDGDL